MHFIKEFSEKEKNYKLVKDIPVYQDVINSLKCELEKVDKRELPNNIYFWCDSGDYKNDFIDNLIKNIDVNIVHPLVEPLKDFYMEGTERKPINDKIFESVFLDNNTDKDKKSILLLNNFELTNETCLKLAEKYLNKDSRNQTNISNKWVIFAIGENPFGWDDMGQGNIFNYTKYFDNYIADPSIDVFLKYAKSCKRFDGKVGSVIIEYLSKNKDDLYGMPEELNGALPIRWDMLNNMLEFSLDELKINEENEKDIRHIKMECCGHLGNRIGEKFFKFLCEKEKIV